MIETKYGRISGKEMEFCTEYVGVPYAAPPVGGLRWKAPEPLQPWEGVYAADHDPKRSYQLHREPGSLPDREFGGEPISCSEDCLYLNIWVPKQPYAEALPVAFWIHGGAFLRGFANEREYDGTAIARQGVILVSVNYRLGALGYLAHPWLTVEAGTSGNYGLLDQIAALEWVRDNIAAFGGDPKKVTIFGQSAGGMSVLTLMSAPRAQGLFARAIIQSAVGIERDVSMTEAYAAGETFAVRAGVSSLEEMRSLPPEKVLEISEAINAASGRLDFAPVVDGVIVPEGHEAARANLANVPILVGSTKNDLGTDPADPAPGMMYDAAEQFAGQMAARKGQNVYLYYFMRQLPGDDAGAFHSAELWYMFGSLARCWRPFTQDDYRLSERMVTAWTDFMKTGDPGWPACTEQNRHIELLDI